MEINWTKRHGTETETTTAAAAAVAKELVLWAVIGNGLVPHFCTAAAYVRENGEEKEERWMSEIYQPVIH